MVAYLHVFLFQKVQKNRDSMKELCTDTLDIITVIRDRIGFHRDTTAIQFQTQCEELERRVIPALS
jgi:hypothetical protein